tara:strand:+ start:8261 stop:8596 length:336 start_codon:yes stop_codon:yes gene_type:complete
MAPQTQISGQEKALEMASHDQSPAIEPGMSDSRRQTPEAGSETLRINDPNKKSDHLGPPNVFKHLVKSANATASSVAQPAVGDGNSASTTTRTKTKSKDAGERKVKFEDEK